MATYITVDGGTTNTRISLVRDNSVIKTLKYNVGARMGIENKQLLFDTIREGIKSLISECGVSERGVERILASGMLTSEFGVFNLPHVSAPAGVKELHLASEEVSIPEISPIPIVFIPGVKSFSEKLSKTDMMRGEECEIMGAYTHEDKDAVYILPGSHSKMIKIDAEGRISSFVTMLTGEMIYALSSSTILRDSVDLENGRLASDFLLFGYDYAIEYGINESLFKTRVLKNLYSKTKDETYSFFMGAVLSSEVTRIMKEEPKSIVIGGKREIRDALSAIISSRFSTSIRLLSDGEVEMANILGMIRVYEYKSI